MGRWGGVGAEDGQLGEGGNLVWGSVTQSTHYHDTHLGKMAQASSASSCHCRGDLRHLSANEGPRCPCRCVGHGEVHCLTHRLLLLLPVLPQPSPDGCHRLS